MCRDCWHRDGGGVKVVDTRLVDKFRPLCEAVYDAHDMGGGLHIVLDDNNLDDGSIEWCLDQDLTNVERRCANFLLDQSYPTRWALIAKMEGWV